MRGYKIDLSMWSKEKRVEASKQIIDIVVNKYGFRRPKECIGKPFLFFNVCSRSRVLYGTTFSYFDAHTYREITWQDFLEKYESSKLITVNCRCTVIPKSIETQLAFHRMLNSENVAMLEADIEGMELPQREWYKVPLKHTLMDMIILHGKYLRRKEVENIRIPDDGSIPYLIG